MSKFTVGMKLKTRDGSDARILATDVDAARSVVAAVKINKKDTVLCYLPDGRYSATTNDRLDLVLPKEELWVNKSRYGAYIYNTKQRALDARDRCDPAIIYEYVAKRFIEAD